MAGIGVKLNKIYSKRTIATGIWGAGYSTVISIAPMVLVILAGIAGLVTVLSDSLGVKVNGEVTVEVKKDWGPSATTDYLKQQGIIKYPFAFRLQSTLRQKTEEELL